MAASSQPIGVASPESARSFVADLDLARAPPAAGASVALEAASLPSLRAPLAALFGMRAGEAAGLEAAQVEAASAAQPATGSDAIGLKIQAGQDQAFFVGSQLLSFNAEVTDDRRAAAVNSCLLAQLRASKLYPNPDTPEAAQAWHATYVNTLVNIGWALQSGVTAVQMTGTQDASVDKVLLEVVGALIGGGTAIALVTKVIEAISKAKQDDPFIVLYQSRVVEQSVIDFGAGLGVGSGSGFQLSVVECAIQVRSVQRQLLFFKWNADSARAEGRRFDFSIADGVYAAVKPLIEEKVAPFVRNFVAALTV